MPEGAGYSGTPLPKKLGLKPGMTVRLLDPPGHYWSLIGGVPEALQLRELDPGEGEPADFTHLFATDGESLESRFALARNSMAEDGMVRASWPKKSSRVQSSIGRSEVMAAGKDAGLVDVKVCAVDETWSGLKFVIPLAERGG